MEISNLKSGDKININLSGEVESVRVGKNFKAGIGQFEFIDLFRDKGAPYTITLSRLKKIIVQ